MKRYYSCPHCDAILNPNVKIVLRAEASGHRALFLFSPQPGNYDVVIPEGFRLRREQTVRFACPVCARDLTSKRDPSLAEIACRWGSTQATVAFSQTFGHHATYFITTEQVRSFGEHAVQQDMNFWGEGPGE